MAFPPHFLDEIRARLSVSDVVSRKVKLTRRGREFVGLSPFNKEKSPSFTVNDEKGFYHCFSSGEHGDAFTFLMKTEGLSFPEAVEKLATEVGLEVPRATPEEQARERDRKTLHEVVDLAANWYTAQLQSAAGRPALQYLRGRGLDDDTIARFRLGYAPEGRGQLFQSLQAQGTPVDQIIAAGLAKAADERGGPRDYFFGRIIFPITDRRGRVLAFGGRTMGDGQPKYLNSPESSLFHKGAVLYGLAQARDAIRTAETAIVAEGYMDVIALAQAGFANAVAPLGTALTEGQLRELWRITDEPILCFDGDAAGQRAAGRAALRALPLLTPGKSLRIADLPAGEDPDSLIANRGPDALQRVLDGARHLVDMLWEMETAAGRIDTPERRAALRRRLFDRAGEIADQSIAAGYRQTFEERLERQFPPPRRYRRNADVGGRPPAYRRAGQFANRSPLGPPRIPPRGSFDGLATAQEKVLLALLINHPGILAAAAESFVDVALSSIQLDRMLREILNLLGSAPELDTEGLKRHLIETGYADLLDSVLSKSVYSMASFAAPEAVFGEVEEALADILRWYRNPQFEIDRQNAEQDLAENMTDAKADRLVGIMREQLSEDGP